MPKRVYGTGSIVEHRGKNARVILYARWRRDDGTRKQVKLGFKRSPSYADGLTKKQAEAALQAAMANDRKRQSGARPVPRGHLLGDTAMKWLRHLEAKGAAPTYREDAASALDHHILPYFGKDTELKAIDRDAAKGFRDHLLTMKSKHTGRRRPRPLRTT